jgi:penicillin-binding protein 1C
MSAVLRRLGSVLLRIVAVVAMTAAASDTIAAQSPPSFAQVKSAYGTSEALLLDRHGTPLSEIRIDPRVRQLDWIPLADISPAMSATLIAAEDKRFYEHGGVDWPGLAGAAWDSVWRTLDGRRARGGSTLTMQLAGMLDPALALSGSARTLSQKWDQAQAALALERTWTKPEILEAYLNLASYRGELKGLDAAAHGLFGKTPAGLDAREATILVALLRGPNATPALVAQRACSVTAISAPEIACEELRAMTTVALAGAYRLRARWNLAPHLAAKLLKLPGERTTTTLDAGIQRYAIETLREHLAELADRGVGDGAIVVLDNASGDVVAYVGSSGEMSSASRVDGVSASRQAGSTLKPFLYALAIDSRLLTAASLVDDSPVAIATERGMYVPQNYDRQFRGTVSVRTALGSSLNVPAVRTLGLVGIDRFHGVLRQLGFDTLTEPDEYYGASLALGGADVNLLALTNAYRALANGGVYGPPRFVATEGKATTSSRRVFGTQASFVVTDILSDRAARAATFGLENPLATRVWSAAKTGTSKDMRDNWCVGYTSLFTVGVWVGNFSGAPMRDVSGVTGAAPIWRDLIHRLHATELSLPPSAPAGLIEQEVAFEPQVETQRNEWFLPGTQSPIVAAVAGANAGSALTPHIRYPAPDTIIALDPDIADEHQRVMFQASPVVAGMRWRIGDELLADARGRAAWSPVPGHFTLYLENESGQALSSVPFEVRGNIAR